MPYCKENIINVSAPNNDTMVSLFGADTLMIFSLWLKVIVKHYVQQPLQSIVALSSYW
jgi:hypothetical protein